MDFQQPSDVRTRVVRAAARLLHEGGPAAVTTRGVAAVAGVQAPAIYRLFGDKDGLLEAVAEHGMAAQVAEKAEAAEQEARAEGDPIDDLRRAWSGQLAFGLANPHLFRLLSEPERVRTSPAAGEGRRVLAARVHRIAEAGRLRVPEGTAVDLLAAAGVGAIQTLLAAEPGDRDDDLGPMLLDAVLQRVLTAEPRVADDPVAVSALTLRAAAADLGPLTASERALLTEWLDRVGATR